MKQNKNIPFSELNISNSNIEGIGKQIYYNISTKNKEKNINLNNNISLTNRNMQNKEKQKKFKISRIYLTLDF